MLLFCRQAVLIGCVNCRQRGVKKAGNFADITNGWSPTTMTALVSDPTGAVGCHYCRSSSRLQTEGLNWVCVTCDRPKRAKFRFRPKFGPKNISESRKEPKHTFWPKEGILAEILIFEGQSKYQKRLFLCRKREFWPKYPLSAENILFGTFLVLAEIVLLKILPFGFGQNSFGRSL